jgi:hypothetical protein
MTLSQYGGGCWNEYYKHRIEEAHIDNACRLTYKSVMIDKENNKVDKDSTRRYASVQLGAVTDVSFVELDNMGCGHVFAIKFETGSIAAAFDGYGVKSWLQLRIDQSPRASAGAPMPDTPEQMGNRIEKALRHAVDLCRGTYQPPVQPKQPF